MKLRNIFTGFILALALSGSVYGNNNDAASSDAHRRYYRQYRKPVKVKIIAINDFHGQLQSPGSFRSDPDDTLPRLETGGIDWLAGYFADIKRNNRHTTIVSAGDLIGATPLISALFHDEGTIETMNRAGLEIIVENYAAIAEPIANRVIGTITETLSRTANAAGESPLGNIIADAQLAATELPGFGEADSAFMNPGGIRADLTYESGSAGEGDGNVTFGEAFTVQPFGNSLVTLTLTGQQIEALLEQQFTGCTNEQPFDRILQVSEGFSYVWNPAGGACDKVDPASIQLNGVGIDPATGYRVTVNSFLADGGDNFSVLTQGSDRLGGAQDLDALESYFIANPLLSPGALDRILTTP